MGGAGLATGDSSPATGNWFSDARNRLSLLKGLLVFSVLSTGAHYTHNFVEIDQYPGTFVSGAVIQIAILVSWPLLTAIGLYGYRLYARGDYSPAYACLFAYSFLGILTLGHFFDGVPDIPPFFLVTIFTDAIAGFSIAAFVLLSARVRSKLVST